MSVEMNESMDLDRYVWVPACPQPWWIPDRDLLWTLDHRIAQFWQFCVDQSPFQV